MTKPFTQLIREATYNNDGKLYCSHISCLGNDRTFGRLSEWNRHMDRHERPYKCKYTGCLDLPGFTYRGGLSRHVREVHHKRSETNEMLFCSVPNCIRSSGIGFTRRYNLNQHIQTHRDEAVDPALNGAPQTQHDSDTETTAERREPSLSPGRCGSQPESEARSGCCTLMVSVEGLESQLRQKDECIQQLLTKGKEEGN